MFGAPEPTYPQPARGKTVVPGVAEFARPGFVSIWVADFASIEEAETYFGIPDEIGVYLPPEPFAKDFALGYFPPGSLEARFEQVAPQPISALFQEVTFSASFFDHAVGEAGRKGIHEAQGVALIYDYDYQLHPEKRDRAGPVKFTGSFAFSKTYNQALKQQFQEVALRLGCPIDAVEFIVKALQIASQRWRAKHEPEAGQMDAKFFCDYLLSCRGEETPALLRQLGLRRSEDVGRVMFALIEAGMARRQESDSLSDFEGLFSLG